MRLDRPADGIGFGLLGALVLGGSYVAFVGLPTYFAYGPEASPFGRHESDWELWANFALWGWLLGTFGLMAFWRRRLGTRPSFGTGAILMAGLLATIGFVSYVLQAADVAGPDPDYPQALFFQGFVLGALAPLTFAGWNGRRPRPWSVVTVLTIWLPLHFLGWMLVQLFTIEQGASDATREWFSIPFATIVAVLWAAVLAMRRRRGNAPRPAGTQAK